MKFEDYESLINDGLKNPDKAPAVFKSVLENLKTDTETIGSQASKIEEQEGRIRDLQDTNIKLFLAQTSTRTPEKEAPEEKTGQAAIEDFILNLGK